MIKKITLLFIPLILLGGILIFNALKLNSNQKTVMPADAFSISEKAIMNFSKAIQFETISFDNTNQNESNIQMENFEAFLKDTYPRMDSLLNKTVINKYGLLFKWDGKNSAENPIILMAHMDVVPIEEETRNLWEAAPFSGALKENCIYGRGTLDDKPGVIGICEAVEKLLSENFAPEKTIYIAFGFDEEIGGHQGAEKIADFLKSKNITADFVLDEGLSVTDGIIPGMKNPVALIGIAEKGYVSFELSVSYPGGHSSMPEKENAITILSKAILNVQSNPFPSRISEPTNLFLNTIGAEGSFAEKIIFANRWLFDFLIMNQFEKSGAGNAALRTTASSTIFKSGVKENLIPAEAMAVINFRILPGETSKNVEENLIKIINDERVKIKSTGIINEPSPVSSVESNGYKTIEKTIREVFPGILVSPSLVLGATDSKHFAPISENVYRFLPVRIKPVDLNRIHGINERIEIENFKECIRFYYYLIKNNNSN